MNRRRNFLSSFISLASIALLWCSSQTTCCITHAGGSDSVLSAENVAQDKSVAPPAKLIEAERVNPDEVVALMRASLLQEGAVTKLGKRNLDNARYTINEYPL